MHLKIPRSFSDWSTIHKTTIRFLISHPIAALTICGLWAGLFKLGYVATVVLAPFVGCVGFLLIFFIHTNRPLSDLPACVKYNFKPIAESTLKWLVIAGCITAILYMMVYYSPTDTPATKEHAPTAKQEISAIKLQITIFLLLIAFSLGTTTDVNVAPQLRVTMHMLELTNRETYKNTRTKLTMDFNFIHFIIWGILGSSTVFIATNTFIPIALQTIFSSHVMLYIFDIKKKTKKSAESRTHRNLIQST